MKLKILAILTVLSLLFSNCNKKSSLTQEEKESSSVVENVTQYVKNSCYGYANESDIGKDPQNVKEKVLLKFGNAVKVKGSKKIKEKIYYKIALPDNSEYWINKENIAKKFIVINKNDVKCYDNPDETFITKFRLQPGDFGILLQEGPDDWIKVEFNAYRKLKEYGERVWVGVKWIRDGYTTDLKLANQAYLLSIANFYYIQKKEPKNAIPYLKEALSVEGAEESELTPIIKEMLSTIEKGE